MSGRPRPDAVLHPSGDITLPVVRDTPIALSDRPLLVCDVDEVVLEFLTPFQRFLAAEDYEFLPRSFRLDGNIVSGPDRVEAAREEIRALIDGFFAVQTTWQTPIDIAAETLGRLGEMADVVFLTAMPPRHFDLRRRLLDAHGLPYPLIASEAPKGPIVAALHGARPHPVAFVDDIHRNLHSVREHVPACLLVNLMADHALKAFAPDPGDGVVVAADWHEAEMRIRAHFSA